MPRPCDHNIPESLRGRGECSIAAEVKNRNGKPRWWCTTHQLSAGRPDGSALEECPGSWSEPVPPEARLEVDVQQGQLAIWGALEPALIYGSPWLPPGSVHVHHRTGDKATKDIDASYDIVTVRNGPRELIIDGVSARAYSISELTGREVKALACPHCGNTHLDELKFATFPHVKHQCNRCGRNFWDKAGSSVSNPLANSHLQLGLPPAGPPRLAPRQIAIATTSYTGIAIWPSNAAILSTMSRPEEAGIHVHAWNGEEARVVDDTFAAVTINGRNLDHEDLRILCAQRALAHDAPILALRCDSCGQPLKSDSDSWCEPRTTHPCCCGATMRTRRRSFTNPLATA